MTLRYIPPEEREPDDEPASREVALHWLARLAEVVGGTTLEGTPATWKPNACDVVTKTEVCRCGQCEEHVRLLYLYPAEKPRRVLCADCAQSRVHAGAVLERETPWFLSGDEPPACERKAA